MRHPQTSVILFAHGSKAREANEGIAHLAEALSRQSGYPAQAAFLELAPPDLAGAVAAACQSGSRRVIVVPCFLTMGMHMREDLPRLMDEQRAKHPEAEILVSQPLEGHPGLGEILLDRVREALSSAASMSTRAGKE